MAGGKGLLAGNIVQWDGEGLHWGHDFPRTDGSSFTVLAWHIVMRGRREAVWSRRKVYSKQNAMALLLLLIVNKLLSLSPSPLDCQKASLSLFL